MSTIHTNRKTSYVLCFPFVVETIPNGIVVAESLFMIRKNRPKWMAGRLNGIGGNVEPGEFHRAACIREVREEAGIDIEPHYFGTCLFPDCIVTCWYALIDKDQAAAVSSMTDEKIERVYRFHIESALPDMVPHAPILIQVAGMHVLGQKGAPIVTLEYRE